MEVSRADRPVSPAKANFQQVVLKTVPGEHQKSPGVPIIEATVTSSCDDTSFDSSQLNTLAYNPTSWETTSPSSLSSTEVLPTTSSATSSVSIGCSINNSEEGAKSNLNQTFGITWKHWKWEIAACFLVVGVPIVTVVTTFPHTDQPIPQWPFKITINALLSVYSLVFKSAVAYVVTSCVGQLQWAWFASDSRPRALSDVVLFDSAGRGPWGLLTMLWEHQIQQPLIILAAVIMISGLAIDPFAQQLIRPFDCSAPLDHHIATLPRTNQIDNYFSSGDEGEILTHTLRSALVAGLFSSGNEIPFECSTGNCTFSEVYNTLGICSACEDLSSKTVVESKRRNPSLNFNTQNITTYFSSGDGSRYWGVQGEQLNTSFFGSFYDRPTDVARMDIRSLPVDDFLLRVDILVGKTTYSDDRRLISTGQNITGCDTAEASNTWACRGYGAASCTLQPCIRTYRAKIEAGFLTEQLVSKSPDIRWGSPRDLYYHGLLDTECLSIQDVAFLETRSYELHNTSRWIPFYGDLSNNNRTTYGVSSDWVSNVESLLRHKCLYLISRWFISKVGYGNGRGPSARDPAASQFVGTVRGLMWDENESDENILNVFDGPEILQNIYNYGKVDFERIQSVFKNISDSLTTFIRTHGNTSYSEPARGQVQHYATCLGVQWPWITLPAGIAMLLILFLILVAENTRKRETPVWKASPLPWILGSGLRNHDSPLGSERVIKSAVTVARMEDESRQILIALSDGTAPTIGMTHMRDHNLQITKA